MHFENFTINSSYAKVLLGVAIDSNLSFSENGSHSYATANRKLHALSRVSKYISLEKRMKSFIISQCRYCSLIWMTHSRGLNNKVDYIYKRALRIVYKVFTTSFEGV